MVIDKEYKTEQSGTRNMYNTEQSVATGKKYSISFIYIIKEYNTQQSVARIYSVFCGKEYNSQLSMARDKILSSQ